MACRQTAECMSKGRYACVQRSGCTQECTLGDVKPGPLARCSYVHFVCDAFTKVMAGLNSHKASFQPTPKTMFQPLGPTSLHQKGFVILFLRIIPFPLSHDLWSGALEFRRSGNVR